MKRAPSAIPVINLPTYSRTTEFENAMRNHGASCGIASKSKAHFLPIISTRIALNGPPIKYPNGAITVMYDASSTLMFRWNSGD